MSEWKPEERRSDPTGSIRSRNRGVSEVLGHVLVFSLVVASIGLIVITGLGGLEDTRESEQLNNAERAFDVLADNMASVYERNSPSRTTEIDLQEASISYDDPVTINITGNGTTAENFTREFEVTPLEYSVSSDQSIVYEGGAVFRDDVEGSVVLNEPPFLLTDDQFHTPIIQTRAAEMRQVSGTTVLIRGESTVRSVLEQDRPGTYDELHISITSPRYESWNRYLEEKRGTDCSVDDENESVVCTLSGDGKQVYVTFQRIELSIDV